MEISRKSNFPRDYQRPLPPLKGENEIISRCRIFVGSSMVIEFAPTRRQTIFGAVEIASFMDTCDRQSPLPGGWPEAGRRQYV
ncbi:hypothetical protein BJN34_22115 [Cupriavidus necator]|uniref:Uncharacterized protein n=1 Tax=Cupriavidus necator TaxID=106590 RepID=A0A1U9UWR1_CUPNE|nr:hypothetical protein BJN34_22115 [Cupriavidus necator]